MVGRNHSGFCARPLISWLQATPKKEFTNQRTSAVCVYERLSKKINKKGKP